MRSMIYTVIVLMCITAVLILSGGKTITGRATAEASRDASAMGTYSVLPHFTLQANFSLDKYPRLRIDARKLIEEVSKCSGSLDDCIEQAIGRLELYNAKDKTGWLLRCGYSRERLFYDIAEFYQDCKDSPATDCYCSLDFSKPYPDGRYEIAVRNFGRSTVIESDRMPSIEIQGAAAKKLTYGAGLETYNDIGDQTIIAEYKTGLASADLKITDTVSLDGQLLLYKHGSDLATVLSGDYGKIKERQKCAIKPKRKAYFCVVSDERITAYDAADGQTKQRNLVYKFAVYFPPYSPSDAIEAMQ